jgi:hypothetical protein
MLWAAPLPNLLSSSEVGSRRKMPAAGVGLAVPGGTVRSEVIGVPSVVPVPVPVPVVSELSMNGLEPPQAERNAITAKLPSFSEALPCPLRDFLFGSNV